MTTYEVPHPPIVSREQWLDARKKLLAHEKELTRQYDRVNAERRRLPMVKIEKNYLFEGPGGEESLLDLFQGRRQLVIYHFMFDPSWEKGCPGCTSYANAIGDLGMLDKCDTTFVMVSRAPLSKLEACKERQGWPFTWVSSLGSEFNYDFHVTNDEKIAPVEYNYRNKAECEANKIPNAIVGRRARPQRVLPHRRGCLSHLFGLRARHRGAHRCPRVARRHALWAAAGF